MHCQQIESENIAELYLMGKLGPFEKAQFEIHFIGCRQCAELVAETQNLREVMQLAEPEFSRPRPAAITSRRAWSPRMAALLAAVVVVALLPAGLLLRVNQRLRQQLSQAAATQPSPQPEQQTEQQAVVTTPQDQKPTADPATVRQRDFSVSSPEINVPIFVLSAVRGSDTNELAVDRSQWFVLSLELERRQFENYRATIFTHDSRPFWKSGNLRPDRHDSITIGFSSGFFRPGDYLLVLEGNSNRESFATVATYPFRAVRKKK